MKFRFITAALLAMCVSAAHASVATAAPADAPMPVRFAPERDYGPFVFVDGGGAVRGLSVDLLQQIQRHAGLQVTTLPAAPLSEQLRAVREGRADLLSSLRPTPERAAFLAFSIPYVSVPAILVHRAEGAATAAAGTEVARAGLGSMAGLAVAVGTAYAVEGFVRDRFPQVNWVSVSDDVAALRGVADGRYAAAVVDSASASFIQREHRLAALQAAGPVGFEYLLSFAVPRDRPDLLARIDAGIRSLTPAERVAIVEHWMSPLDPAVARPSTWQSRAVQLGLGLVVLAAAAALWLKLRPAGAPPTAGDASRKGGAT